MVIQLYRRKQFVKNVIFYRIKYRIKYRINVIQKTYVQNLCACGKFPRAKNQSMCQACRRKYQRKYRIRYKEKHGITEAQDRYQNPEIRAKQLLRTYKNNDRKLYEVRGDYFTENEMIDFLRKCAYCGDTLQLGLDRIDNQYGHTKDNVVCACWMCNRTRGDMFSHSEMKTLGECIIKIKKARIDQITATGGNRGEKAFKVLPKM